MLDGLSVNGEAVVKSFAQTMQGEPLLAGGMSADYLNFQQTWLIHGTRVFSGGAVAVALNGANLQAFNAYNLSWQQLGHKMLVTKSDGPRVFEIDGRPIVDVYRQYLGDEVVAKMPDSTIEFPLIIQNQAVPVARSMVKVFEDQSVLFAGNIDQGSYVRFAVADAIALEKARQSMRQKLEDKGVQSCFIYSCAARKSFLHKHLEGEFLPLAEIAPVSGFFTYGEVFYEKNQLHSCEFDNTLLNVTTTVLALTEHDDPQPPYQAFSKGIKSSSSTRQSLSNSALIRLVNQTTQELNAKLDENAKLIQVLNQYQTAINESFIVSKADKFGTITFANPMFEAISGYTEEELLGKNHSLVRHPEMPDSLFQEMWRTILDKKVWRGVIKNRAKNGSEYIVKTSIVPILDRHGEVSEFLSLREDITAQEAQRLQLEYEREKVQSILDNQKNIVVMTHSKIRKLIVANQAFVDFLQLPSIAHFLVNHECICDLFVEHPDFLQKKMGELEWFEYVLAHPEKDHVAGIYSPDGALHLFSVSVSRLQGDENKVISNFADITLLEQARQRAVSAEQAQSMFLANMSHELRTPINGILGFADLLSETHLDGEQKRFVDILRSSSRHLLSVVNDILDISKIEKGEIELNNHPEQSFVDMEKIVVSFSSVAQQKGVYYQVQLSPKMPECLSYDNMRLHQVLANLISNAIKFTREGGKVEVRVEPVELAADQVWMQFSVQDSGIGIAKDKQDLVFDTFKQANSSTTKEFGGTGLGLSIANQLVKKMGGDKIHLESAEGQGSRFFFRLPMSICDTELTIAKAFKTLRVGVFGEHSLLSSEVENYLRCFGVQVEQGESVCMQECSNQHCVFDVCLVLTNRAFGKVQSTFNPHTYYVFFESPASQWGDCANVIFLEDFEQNNARLYNLMLDYVNNVLSQKVIKESPLFENKILLVEDNSVNQLLMLKLFEHFKLQADVANNGLEAVEMYQQYEYGLVLMDINMPMMGGEEALQKIQEFAAQTHKVLCPIVALTANVLPEQVGRYKELGFHSHLSKPIEVHKLTELLSHLQAQA